MRMMENPQGEDLGRIPAHDYQTLTGCIRVLRHPEACGNVKMVVNWVNTETEHANDLKPLKTERFNKRVK